MNDFHSHLDLCDRPLEVYSETVKRNAYTLSVTIGPGASTTATKLFPLRASFAIAPGLHPDIAHMKKDELPILLEQIRKSPFVGEIGLDGSPHFRGHRAVQFEIFRIASTACAQASGRVVSIHSRKAARPVLDTIEEIPNL
jgi:TatD DNase family protein